MKEKFSKPSLEISKELAFYSEKQDQLHELKESVSSQLSGLEQRRKCICCAEVLVGDTILHRGHKFIFCKKCGHLQSFCSIPDAYPHATPLRWEFNQVYQQLSKQEYQDRKERIYMPKLDWFLEVMQSKGVEFESLCDWVWTEIGAGAGYFISALEDKGIHKATGLEIDIKLASYAKQIIGKNKVKESTDTFHESIRKNPSNVFCSFFVLEHIEDLSGVWNELKKQPSGTIFYFAVPVFGFSSILDNIFPDAYVRNFDAVVHTQLFTDESIAYAMEQADFDIEATWYFGQDISDMLRYFATSLGANQKNKQYLSLLQKLNELQDSLQANLDEGKLSDQRHVIAVKR